MRPLLPMLLLAAAPAWAEITVDGAIALRPFEGAPSGAVYLVVENTGPGADRLLGASAPGLDVARVELHRSEQAADGTMRMEHREDGLEIAPGDRLVLAPGGDHVMLMGLGAVAADAPLTLVLDFAEAGAVEVSAPWGTLQDLDDLIRQAAEGGGHAGH